VYAKTVKNVVLHSCIFYANIGLNAGMEKRKSMKAQVSCLSFMLYGTFFIRRMTFLTGEEVFM
jgi:hypothetical protein